MLHYPRGKIMNSYFANGLQSFGSPACFLHHFFRHLFLRLPLEQGSLHGTVRDPLGAVVAGATVELLNGALVVKKTTTDGTGSYAFDVPENSRYSVRAVAPTFQSTTSESVYLTKSTKAEMDITLATQTLTQQVSVTASATPTPIAQIGASVTVLTADDYRQYTEVQDPLRQIPGVASDTDRPAWRHHRPFDSRRQIPMRTRY